MGNYYKYINMGNVCVIDVRFWDEESYSGTANYYRNGKLYAELQLFIPQDNDIEITEEEFNTLTQI